MTYGDYSYNDMRFDGDRVNASPMEPGRFNTSMSDASNLLRGVFENFAQSSALSSMIDMPRSFMPYAGASSLLDSMPFGMNAIGQGGLENIGRTLFSAAGPLLGALASQGGLPSFLMPNFAPQTQDYADDDEESSPQSFAPRQYAQPYEPQTQISGIPQYQEYAQRPPLVIPPAVERSDNTYEAPAYSVPAQQGIPPQRFAPAPPQRFAPAPSPVDTAETANARQTLAELRDLRQQYDFSRHLPIRKERAMQMMAFMPAQKQRTFAAMFENMSRDGRTLTRQDIDAYSMKYEGRRFFETA